LSAVAGRAYVAAMFLSAGDYRPRDAGHAVLYRVIGEHLDAFLETARRHADGAPLPDFVEQEFREFLTCGVLAHGFARLRCTDCALERLVPFSCKGRGFCPSCGGRRMTESAARLVDDVLPRVPVRQWVLSLPYRLRYLLAWDHALARAVLGVYVRALLGFQRDRARRHGIRDGRSGSVTVIQRFGGGLNLNVHFHTLMFDGVFFADGATGVLHFRALPPPTDEEVGVVLTRIAARVQHLLTRRGLNPDATDVVRADPVADESPAGAANCVPRWVSLPIGQALRPWSRRDRALRGRALSPRQDDGEHGARSARGHRRRGGATYRPPRNRGDPRARGVCRRIPLPSRRHAGPDDRDDHRVRGAGLQLVDVVHVEHRRDVDPDRTRLVARSS